LFFSQHSIEYQKLYYIYKTINIHIINTLLLYKMSSSEENAGTIAIDIINTLYQIQMSSSEEKEYCCELCDYKTTNPDDGTFAMDGEFVCDDCEDTGLYPRCDCCDVIQIGEQADAHNRYCDYACISEIKDELYPDNPDKNYKFWFLEDGKKKCFEESLYCSDAYDMEDFWFCRNTSRLCDKAFFKSDIKWAKEEHMCPICKAHEHMKKVEERKLALMALQKQKRFIPFDVCRFITTFI